MSICTYLILLREALSSSTNIRFYDALTVYFVFTAANVVSRETQIASRLLIPQGLCKHVQDVSSGANLYSNGPVYELIRLYYCRTKIKGDTVVPVL